MSVRVTNIRFAQPYCLLITAISDRQVDSTTISVQLVPGRQVDSDIYMYTCGVEFQPNRPTPHELDIKSI